VSRYISCSQTNNRRQGSEVSGVVAQRVRRGLAETEVNIILYARMMVYLTLSVSHNYSCTLHAMNCKGCEINSMWHNLMHFYGIYVQEPK
jgi:hypothetical protein